MIPSIVDMKTVLYYWMLYYMIIAHKKIINECPYKCQPVIMVFMFNEIPPECNKIEKT